MNAKIIFVATAVLSLLALAFLATQKTTDAQVMFFAYGSNLGMETMNARAGGYRDVAAARAYGYRLVFESNKKTEFGVANIVQYENESVAGAVYWLSEEQMAALDKSAGVPGFYTKKIVVATFADGRKADTTAYVLSGNALPVPPSKPTMMAAVAGLRQFGYGKEDENALADAAARAETG